MNNLRSLIGRTVLVSGREKGSSTSSKYAILSEVGPGGISYFELEDKRRASTLNDPVERVRVVEGYSEEQRRMTKYPVIFMWRKKKRLIFKTWGAISSVEESGKEPLSLCPPLPDDNWELE